MDKFLEEKIKLDSSCLEARSEVYRAKEEREFRDRAAIAALQGMLANPDISILKLGERETGRSELARGAYSMADEMLRARKKEG